MLRLRFCCVAFDQFELSVHQGGSAMFFAVYEPNLSVPVFLYQPSILHGGIFREGVRGGSGGKGLVGNDPMQHPVQASEVSSVLQQATPDDAGLPARYHARADQKEVRVKQEPEHVCTASLCIASRWDHQPTTARQHSAAYNVHRRVETQAAATGGFHGEDQSTGKHSRRPGFCSTKFWKSFLRKHRSPITTPKERSPP